MRRVFVLLAVLLALPSADPLLGQGCDSEQQRQFDFWVGDWEVVGQDGQVAGENRVEKILAGCVIQESWTGAQGSEGKSFNMYFQRDGQWHQTWVDNAGGRLDLTGGLDDEGRMVLSGTMPGREGGSVLHEISWTPQKDGTVVQHWRASKDRGKSWQDLFVGTYRRK